jgi:dimethylamine/trimethylamine dehydrogenase
VTGRVPQQSLYDDLMVLSDGWGSAGIATVVRIGDCLVPSSIADAVHGGHRYARALDDPDAGLPVRRERPEPFLREEGEI